MVAVYTDRLPAGESLRVEYFKSDRLHTLDVPEDDRLHAPATRIQAAMESGESRAVRKPCQEFLFASADFYGVVRPQIRVLAARPLRVREGGWAIELFGDYHREKKLIRVWMRTAAPPCSITTHGERRRRGSSGCRCGMAAGGSTGRARIVARKTRVAVIPPLCLPGRKNGD